MTFSRDVSHYRAAPRSLQTSKFGCYATLSTTRRTSLGTMACWAVTVLSIVAATWVLSGCGQQVQRPFDATDDARAGIRSDLELFTDHGTGCQYVRPANDHSSITPRLDSDGRPMCGKASKTKAVTLVSAR